MSVLLCQDNTKSPFHFTIIPLFAYRGDLGAYYLEAKTDDGSSYYGNNEESAVRLVAADRSSIQGYMNLFDYTKSASPLVVANHLPC